MALISVTKTYKDGDVLLEADLDGMKSSIEQFVNVTRLNDDNLQDDGITGSTKLADGSVTQAKLASNAVSTSQIVDSSITLAKLASALQQSLVPSGSVLAFGGTTAPSGYLLCDGSAVSRTTYASLFAAVGIAHGQGDGSTTFNLPDYRGRFLRGRDGGTGRDPDAGSRTAMNTGGNTGDTVGSVQDDATAKNGLTITDPGHTHGNEVGTAGAGTGWSTGTFPNSTLNTTASSSTGITLNAGDSETRPLNANVNWIIKA